MKILHTVCIFWICLGMASGCAPAAPTPTVTAAPTATAAPALPVQEVHPEWEADFEGYPGAMAVYDSKQERYLRYNPAGCAEGYRPASTFKILNGLIALETGVIPDRDYAIAWDGTRYEVPAWNQDQTFASALQNSVVWYFQEVARRVGRERMQAYVDRVGYGNQNIGGAIDSFWLDGELRISADQQIEFLKRLYAETLPFAPANQRLIKELLVVEKTAGYTLVAKTGQTTQGDRQIGWWVGYVETTDDVVFFATNIFSPNADASFGAARSEITRKVLSELGVLP